MPQLKSKLVNHHVNFLTFNFNGGLSV